MADQKLTALSAITTPTDDDLLYVVNDPSGTPTSNKITWANIKATLLSWLQTITTLFVPISTPTALADGASVTVNADSTDNKMFTLSASNTTCTLALSNLVDGHTCQIIIAPQSTATFTFTFTHAGLTMKVADAGSADWALDATSGKYYRVFITRVGSNGFISFDSRSY
jgi:hypothetical protein